MTILVAREFEPGRYRKCFTAKLSREGRGTIGHKWCGSIESAFARAAARYFAGEPACVELFFEHGVRCTLVK